MNSFSNEKQLRHKPHHNPDKPLEAYKQSASKLPLL